MVLLVVEEAAAVRDQILKIANLGHVNRGVVGLSNDSIPNRKPNSARGRVRSSDAILASSSPSRFNARFAESSAVTAKLCHRQFTSHQAATFALNPRVPNQPRTRLAWDSEGGRKFRRSDYFGAVFPIVGMSCERSARRPQTRSIPVGPHVRQSISQCPPPRLPLLSEQCRAKIPRFATPKRLWTTFLSVPVTFAGQVFLMRGES